MTKIIDRTFSIAPMLDCTDRHTRYFLRLFSKNLLLYTEMVTANAITHGDKPYLLDFSNEEHPVAVQIGGSDPQQLKEVAKICEQWGYDEINLNVGCPSDRVQSGFFGACLMAKPELVAECVDAMKQVVSIPVTVKHRIGIDDQESFEELHNFCQFQVDAGVDALIIHARKAWLKGLSPKQNREIPPLNYDWVYQIKKLFNETEIIINGGIKTIDESLEHLKHVDGVMLGREPYSNPFMMHNLDSLLFKQESDHKSRKQIIEEYIPYIESKISQGIYLTKFIRPIIGMFHEQANSKKWRRYLSENAYKKGSGVEVIRMALEFVD